MAIFETRPRLVAAALAIISAITFAPAVDCGFISFDDPIYVTVNPFVQGGLSVENAVWAVTTLDAGYWMPATWLSLELDGSLYGSHPAGFHFTNLLFHAINSALLYLVLLRATGCGGRSAAVALLWSVHPLRVESVAWVTERKDVLSGLFTLLTIAAYLRYVEIPSKGRFSLVLLGYTMALSAKPMAVTLPCVLLLLDYWPLRRLRTPSQLMLEKWPLFILTILFSVVTYYAQGLPGYEARKDFNEVPFGERTTVAFTGYVEYLSMTFYPGDLAILYPLPSPPRSATAAISAASLLTSITAVALALRRRACYFLVGWLWFVGMLVPVSGLMQSGEQAYADRFTYLPNIGLTVAVVWLLTDLAARVRCPRLAQCLLIALLGGVLVAITRHQLSFWQNDRVVWERVVAVTPGCARGWACLGLHYVRERNLTEGLRCLDEAARLGPVNGQFEVLRNSIRKAP